MFDASDYDFVAGQIENHYKGSHGMNVNAADFIGKAPEKEEKKSNAETIDTYPMNVVSSSDEPVVEEPVVEVEPKATKKSTRKTSSKRSKKK